MGAPFVRGSETSRAAADQIETSVETLREKVYDAIKSTGRVGMTDIEIQRVLGIDGNTQRPRRIELVNAQRIKDSSYRRNTPSGRSATVWVAV